MTARHVLRADLPLLEEVLLDAFAEDPQLTWLYPDGRETARGWFSIALRAGMRRGHTYRAADGTGAAIWAPPGVNNFDRAEGAALRDDMAAGYGDAGLARLTAVAEATAAAHPHEPHFYLFIIGVAGRGRGTGAELLAPVLSICDSQGWPAYLESSNPLNVSFYERHGFTPTQDIVVEDGPSLLGMWRAPQAR